MPNFPLWSGRMMNPRNDVPDFPRQPVLRGLVQPCQDSGMACKGIRGVSPGWIVLPC